jgi:hypothetical protein
LSDVICLPQYGLAKSFSMYGSGEYM